MRIKRLFLAHFSAMKKKEKNEMGKNEIRLLKSVILIFKILVLLYSQKTISLEVL